AVQHPPRLPVVARLVVVDGEARLFERLQVAPDRPRGDAALVRKVVDGGAGGARLLDLAQDRPLADHFGVSRHRRIVQVPSSDEAEFAAWELSCLRDARSPHIIHRSECEQWCWKRGSGSSECWSAKRRL